MGKKDFTAQNLDIEGMLLRHPLQFAPCVFISCLVPAGSGPEHDACPDSPL